MISGSHSEPISFDLWCMLILQWCYTKTENGYHIVEPSLSLHYLIMQNVYVLWRWSSNGNRIDYIHMARLYFWVHILVLVNSRRTKGKHVWCTAICYAYSMWAAMSTGSCHSKSSMVWQPCFVWCAVFEGVVRNRYFLTWLVWGYRVYNEIFELAV